MSTLTRGPPQRARAPVWAVALTLAGLAFTPGPARADFIFSVGNPGILGNPTVTAPHATLDISGNKANHSEK
jgi:hypothetical protein